MDWSFYEILDTSIEFAGFAVSSRDKCPEGRYNDRLMWRDAIVEECRRTKKFASKCCFRVFPGNLICDIFGVFLFSLRDDEQ